LTSLPIYAISFFKAPSSTIFFIESLLNKYFWGRSEDHKKISWIGWKIICLRKKYWGVRGSSKETPWANAQGTQERETSHLHQNKKYQFYKQLKKT
jgi:hypothetical protein